LKKKIYLAEIADHEFLDLTLETIKLIKSCDCILFNSGLSANLINNIKVLNKNFLLKEMKDEASLKLCIEDLFRRNNSIIYLFSSIKPFFNTLDLGTKFFIKNDVDVFLLNQTLEILNIFNKNDCSLTDRRKNSTLDFFYINKIFEIDELIKKSNKEKIIFMFNTISSVEPVELENLNNKKFFKILGVNNQNELFAIDQKFSRKVYLKYFIFEFNEEI
tara:strand:- start:1740 stop:2393 length:654 start_codon:yes stop_codon:yes gene_type:complete